MTQNPLYDNQIMLALQLNIIKFSVVKRRLTVQQSLNKASEFPSSLPLYADILNDTPISLKTQVDFSKAEGGSELRMIYFACGHITQEK